MTGVEYLDKKAVILSNTFSKPQSFNTSEKSLMALKRSVNVLTIPLTPKWKSLKAPVTSSTTLATLAPHMTIELGVSSSKPKANPAKNCKPAGRDEMGFPSPSPPPPL